MNILHKVKDWLWSSDPKWDPDDVVCTVDDKEVDMSVCDNIPDPFVDKITLKGFIYDAELSDITGERWSRKWSTETGPEESILEVYSKSNDGDWSQQMIGYGGRVFYEEEVDVGESN